LTAPAPKRLVAATLGRMPILWQSLLMVTLSLLASALVSLMLIWALPMPRLDFFSMHDIAEAIRAVERGEPPADPLIQHRITAAPPVVGDDLRSDIRMTQALATQLGRPLADVALVYRADQTNFPFRYRTEAGVPLRQGEAQFYNSVFAATRAPDGKWIMVETPKRPLITRFQRRSIMAFLLSVLVTLPLAYLFARQLAAPIRRFADAAERVGADNTAPAVPAEGSTELRLAAVALTKMQSRINDTMAERTAMIGAIAHDLRTPLTRIAFRIEAAPAPLREAVQADIDQMRAMVEAAIGFIRHGNKVGDQLPVDLVLLVDRIAVDSQAMALPVTIGALPNAPAVIAGDAVALGRMLQNLVDNALIYAGSAEISVAIAGEWIDLAVADRGPGLDPALLDEMFKPFKRGEPSRNRATGGLGLGLALARLTASAHGGTISARNRQNGGLRVVARFPAAVPPQRRSRARATPRRAGAAQPAE
jgi:two-component system, OmpR family, sensor kinase